MYPETFPSPTDCYVPRNVSLTASHEFHYFGQRKKVYWIFLRFIFAHSIQTEGYKETNKQCIFPPLASNNQVCYTRNTSSNLLASHSNSENFAMQY